MSEYLNQDFIVELVKSFYQSEKIVEICKKNLKYQFLQSEAQKKVIKFIFDNHVVTGQIPTPGVMGQKFNSDSDVISFLSQVKRTKRVNTEQTLAQLEAYIKNVRFQKLLERLVGVFNAGNHEQAISELAKESKDINEFGLRESYYSEVFTGFKDRMIKAKETYLSGGHDLERLLEKCTTGVHEVDEYLKGGIKKGKSACVLARSGRGKSTWLRWIGLCNARLGMRVVHFQAEGSEKECIDNYNAAWTGLSVDEIEMGELPHDRQYKIYKTHTDIVEKGGRIYVYASESFESMSLSDARQILLDIEALHGPIDLVLWDYASLFQVEGNYTGDSAERRRMEKVCNQITNIAVEFKCACVTAIQANDIDPKFYNNSSNSLTRHHISEFKQAIAPFSYFFTLNGTDDEYEAGICRIYGDKFRDHKSGWTSTIYQSLKNGRFYDSKKTLEEFYIS